MLILFLAFIALAAWYLLIAPAIGALGMLSGVPFAAISAAVVALLHRTEEGWCGNQADINGKVFGNSRGMDWPITDWHNKWLHQGFIFAYLGACCAGALLTGSQAWLVPVAGVFLADWLQHCGFHVVATWRDSRAPSWRKRGHYVGGFWTAQLYGAWALVWLVAQSVSAGWWFTFWMAAGFVLIFGNLAGLALKHFTGLGRDASSSTRPQA